MHNKKYSYKLFWRLMRLDKPVGSILLLWPTWLALWVATSGTPDLKIIIIFTLGVIITRSLGCVINDLFDKDFDSKVLRTKSRPLATQELKVTSAVKCLSILIILSLLLACCLNYYAIILSIIAAILIIIYPLLKRFTYLPQLGLGCAFSMAIPMAFTAVYNFDYIAMLLLFMSNLFWTIAFDTQYAMADRDCDLKVGIKSTAILFAKLDNMIIYCLQLTAVMLLITLGVYLNLSIYFYLGLIISILLFFYQAKLTYNREPDLCLQAFLNNKYVGLLWWLGVVAHFYIVGNIT